MNFPVEEMVSRQILGFPDGDTGCEQHPCGKQQEYAYFGRDIGQRRVPQHDVSQCPVCVGQRESAAYRLEVAG